MKKPGKRWQATVGAALMVALAVLGVAFNKRTGWGIMMGGVQVRKLDAAAGSLKATVAATGISTHLRFDWADLALSSPMARYWHAHQRNCTLRRAPFQFRNRYGMGHELHMWTQALCNAAESDVRIHTSLPWTFRDSEACTTPSGGGTNGSDGPPLPPPPVSALQCYFPGAEPDCPQDYYVEGATAVGSRELDPSGRLDFYKAKAKDVVRRQCPNVLRKFNASLADVRASAIEYMFASTSQVVINEALRQLDLLFGAVDATSFSRLITVHIRWGDKRYEVDLVPIHEYVRAVQTLLAESEADHPSEGGKVGIYLSTEDPLAMELFEREAAKYNWTVFVDVYLQEFSAVRDGKFNGNPHLAQNLHGRPGLVALASLLVAMQSDYFVLTTTSNWSRLMNALRMAILDPRCNKCTRMIDLSPGEW